MPRRASSAPRHPDPAGSSPGSPAPASSSPAHVTVGVFAPDEWRLLTRLPAEVMVAAIAVQADRSHRTVAEGLAGLDAIAAGRSSDSDLVRAAVAAIFAEPEEDRPAGQEPVDPADRLARVLDDCRRAADILRARADPADAATYRQWMQHVAARVCRASRSGGVFALPGERLSAAERELLDALAAALG